MTDKLALGTAQFGLAYGISNRAGQVPKAEVFKILDLAAAAGINLLDTAFAYGTSEAAIGSYLGASGRKFRLVSKLPPRSSAARRSLIKSLQRLRAKKLSGYLVHDFAFFRRNPRVLKVLQELKKEGLIEKIGFSLYHPAELEYLLRNDFSFQLVQFPYSVLDQRFAPLLPLLQKKKIEVHVRSVYLQGLVFRAPQSLSGQFKPIAPKLTKLQQIAASSGLSTGALCLNFALLNKGVDKVIIGVDSARQLQENLDFCMLAGKVKKLLKSLAKLHESDEQIILPTNWPAKV